MVYPPNFGGHIQPEVQASPCKKLRPKQRTGLRNRSMEKFDSLSGTLFKIRC